MNTVVDQKRTLLYKAFSILAVALFCMSILTRTVLADMGPKRSIWVSLKNLPEEPYYIALLQPGSLPDDRERYFTRVKLPDEDAEIREIFVNYEEDGFILFTYGGGTSSIRSSEDMKVPESLSYGYMVPSTFKVIVVTRSGEVTVSNKITARAFHSECEYDYSNNTLKEVNFASNFSKNLAMESLLFCGITLVVEGIVLLCFGLFRKKNLLRFLIANLITQTLLYGFNLTCRLIDPLWQNYFIVWLVVEALITLIELFIYLKKFVRKDGTVSVGRNIAYAITANAISAFIDIPIVFIAYLMH